MVLFLLHLKAELENVQSITINRSTRLCLSVRNPQSDYEVRDKVVVDPSTFVEQEESSREPPHHFSLRWEGNKKAATLVVLSQSEAKTAMKKLKKKAAAIAESYTADDSGQWVPLLAVECRGMEPYAFHPMGQDEFKVSASNDGAEFTEGVDFSEGDWADYDAENDQPVSISEIEFKVRVL